MKRSIHLPLGVGGGALLGSGAAGGGGSADLGLEAGQLGSPAQSSQFLQIVFFLIVFLVGPKNLGIRLFNPTLENSTTP